MSLQTPFVRTRKFRSIKTAPSVATDPNRSGWYGVFAALALVSACALLPGLLAGPSPRDTTITVAVGPGSGALRADETHINTAVQDATGRIWGINTWTADAFYE